MKQNTNARRQKHTLRVGRRRLAYVAAGAEVPPDRVIRLVKREHEDYRVTNVPLVGLNREQRRRRAKAAQRYDAALMRYVHEGRMTPELERLREEGVRDPANMTDAEWERLLDKLSGDALDADNGEDDDFGGEG